MKGECFSWFFSLIVSYLQEGGVSLDDLFCHTFHSINILFIQLPSDFNTPKPAMLQPNKRGYTVMADAFSHDALPSTPWGVRFLSNPELPTVDKGGFSQLTTQMPSREMMGSLAVRRGDEIFR